MTSTLEKVKEYIQGYDDAKRNYETARQTALKNTLERIDNSKLNYIGDALVDGWIDIFNMRIEKNKQIIREGFGELK